MPIPKLNNTPADLSADLQNKLAAAPSLEPEIKAENVSFRKLIEKSYEGITLLDRNFHIIYRSPSAERITGWNAVERARSTLNDVIHPDDRMDIIKLLEALLNAPGTSDTCIFRSKLPDGNYMWLECVFTNLLDDKDVNAIVLNFRDITEKKRSEEVLTETMLELMAYKYALDESSIVAITDQKGVIKHVNENFCKISKYTEEELIGQDHRIINSSYHDKEFIRNLWTTIANGHIWRGELKNRAKDDTHYWVDTTIVPFLNEKGKPYQYVAIRSDITERKLAELELIKMNKQIEDLLETMADGFISLDENLRYIYANKQIGKILNRNEKELLGKHIWDEFPEAIGSPTWDAIQTCLRDKIYICNEDYYAPLKLWQENRVYPSGDGVSVFIRDITQKKQEEQHLKLLETVITHSADAVVITEAEPQDVPGPRILYVNDAFTRMTGYTADEVIGQSPRLLQGPNTDKHELERLKQCLISWQPCNVTVVNYRKDGSEFWVNIMVSPVANANGIYTHWIAIQRDVTEMLNYIKEIEAHNKKLQEISWMQSHIIRAPLSRIMGLIELFRAIKDDKDNETRQILDFISASAQELDGVIKGIIQKSQADNK